MQKGFTLIELLVVVSLTTLLMVTAASVFVTFMIGNEKTVSTQALKSEGNYALGQMEFLLRNSLRLIPNTDGYTCGLGMDKIAFESWDGGKTELMVENDTNDDDIVKIASNSGIYLTSGETALVVSGSLTNNDQDPVGKLRFDCVESPDSTSKYVTISFSLRKGEVDIDQDRDITQQDFTTGVSLRN